MMAAEVFAEHNGFMTTEATHGFLDVRQNNPLLGDLPQTL
jgi:hypothetical protein